MGKPAKRKYQEAPLKFRFLPKKGIWLGIRDHVRYELHTDAVRKEAGKTGLFVKVIVPVGSPSLAPDRVVINSSLYGKFFATAEDAAPYCEDIADENYRRPYDQWACKESKELARSQFLHRLQENNIELETFVQLYHQARAQIHYLRDLLE